MIEIIWFCVKVSLICLQEEVWEVAAQLVGLGLGILILVRHEFASVVLSSG